MDLLRILIVPPASCLLLVLVGFAILRWRKKLAWTLVACGLLSLWAASAPIVAANFLRTLQVDPPLRPDASLPEAGAIVVLGAGVAREADEFGGLTIDRIGLERVRYAALLHHRSGVPVLVTGGPGGTGEPPVAELMARVLENELDVDEVWRENASADTAENARFSALVLAEHGIERVFVVTHAWHLPRARAAFERAGLEVVAAPTGFRAPQDLTVEAFFPNAKALHETMWACHEWIGRLWYAIRG